MVWPRCPAGVLGFFHHFGFEFRRNRHSAGGNLFVVGAVIAQLAHAQLLSERTGGPKTRQVMGRAAYKSHKPVAGIERRTRLVISEIFEALAGVLILTQQTSRGVTGKIRRQARSRFARPAAAPRVRERDRATRNSRRPSCSRSTSS